MVINVWFKQYYAKVQKRKDGVSYVFIPKNVVSELKLRKGDMVNVVISRFDIAYEYTLLKNLYKTLEEYVVTLVHNVDKIIDVVKSTLNPENENVKKIIEELEDSKRRIMGTLDLIERATNPTYPLRDELTRYVY